jgi:SAM-dependent methyltransferase
VIDPLLAGQTEQSYEINRANWDERAAAHAAARSYSVEALLADPTRLSDVVAFDRPRLPDLTGLRGVHLQCHIGTDTLSLHRLGARMSGLDFSEQSLAQARAIAERAGAEIDYHHANVYDAVDIFGESRFDFVFTGVGALCWLPKIQPWASVIARLLRPAGQLFLREGHPMLWTLDDQPPAGLRVVAPYFEHAAPYVYASDSTYADTDATFQTTVSHTWNHGLGEVVTALLDNAMQVTTLVEHDSVPWNALPGQMVEGSDGEWRLAENPSYLAASYTLHARKTPERNAT